ncbi:hypothetical protein BD779DRAFT_1476971 [Infundibulicybe gibba]|nr:hypothetical protein BD779DRAFT_1476971 [Infundibulicybe gibba]
MPELTVASREDAGGTAGENGNGDEDKKDVEVRKGNDDRKDEEVRKGGNDREDEGVRKDGEDKKDGEVRKDDEDETARVDKEDEDNEQDGGVRKVEVNIKKVGDGKGLGGVVYLLRFALYLFIFLYFSTSSN